MAEYTLRIRRYDPQSGEAPRWDTHTVDLSPVQSVLDAILKIKDDTDGSIGIRCSCQQAICGSCGVRMNGKPGLACNTHLREAAQRAHGTGWNPPDEGQGSPVITVEPMGNMPVIRDLIVDMDAVHWKKIQRVTPWLINKQPVPEREYIVPHENMVDVTQPMACIQCGACVSDCLSMEVDPEFIGPAALAKAYRFVGDPRDAQHRERLSDLSEDRARALRLHPLLQLHRRVPQGRRPDEPDHAPAPDRRLGLRYRGPQQRLPPRARVRQEHPQERAPPRGRPAARLLRRQVPARRAVPELIGSLPTAATALPRGKMTPRTALGHPHKAPPEVKKLFDTIDGKPKRYELNLYVSGYENEAETEAAEAASASASEEQS